MTDTIIPSPPAREAAIATLIEKARALIALHDRFVETVPGEDDEPFEQWAASVDALRAAVERFGAQ